MAHVTQHEIDMVLDAHQHVGNSPLRIVELIRINLLPNDALYNLYMMCDTHQLAHRVKDILRRKIAM